MQISTDGGSSWSDYEKNVLITLVSEGDSVSFRGRNVKTAMGVGFTMTGKIAASGDVTSLTNGTGGDAALTDSCYMGMFSNCTELTSAPELPAETLVSGCYDLMFNDASSLKIFDDNTTGDLFPWVTTSGTCCRKMLDGTTDENGTERTSTLLPDPHTE